MSDNNDIRPGDYSLAGLDPQAAGHDYSDGPPVDIDVTGLDHVGKAGSLSEHRAHYRKQPPQVAGAGAGASVRDIPPVEVERRTLVKRLRSMPFAGLVLNNDLPDPGKTDELFFAATNDWLNEYRGVVQAQSDEFTKQARKVSQLLDERDAVRAFFGLSDDRDQLRQFPVCGLIDAHAPQCRRA